MSSGLYVHIPFCKSKCFYCDFGSIDCSSLSINYNELINQYLVALKEEIRYYSGEKIRTIYIGGGTPTILEGEKIVELLDFCYRNFEVDSKAEVSIEANPGTLDEAKLKLLKEAGVNRLSIGAQSFNDRLLKAIGRIHTVSDFFDNFSSARKVGFDNINIDLIFALPSQDLRDWMQTLEEIVRLRPEHVSIYNLTIEEGTRLYTLLEQNKIEKVSNDLEAEMYEEAISFLVSNGWLHYEMSNFALRGRECIHNKIYWKNEEYIGIGAGATSYLDGFRYTNIRDPEIYIKNVLNNLGYNKKIKWQEQSETLTGRKKVAESVILGLRMIDGMDITPSVEENFNDTITRLIEKRLLEKRGHNIRLTHTGLMFANRVYQEFL